MNSIERKVGVVVIGLLFVSSFAAAQIADPLGGATLPQLITRIAKAIAPMIVTLGTIMVVVSGIFFVLAGADPSMLGKAKSTLIYACIGIVVGLAGDTLIGVATGIAGEASLGAVFTSILAEVRNIIIPLGTIMTIIGGVIYVTAAGSPDRVKMARNMITYAVIGIVIGLLAQTIVSIAQSWAA